GGGHGGTRAHQRGGGGPGPPAGAGGGRRRAVLGVAAHDPAPGPVTATEPAALLHELTRHGSPTDRSRLVDFQPLDPGNRPAPFKRYVGLDTTPLPNDFDDSGSA